MRLNVMEFSTEFIRDLCDDLNLMRYQCRDLRWRHGHNDAAKICTIVVSRMSTDGDVKIDCLPDNFAYAVNITSVSATGHVHRRHVRHHFCVERFAFTTLDFAEIAV